MFGEARFKAEVTPIIKPGILNCAHGWWFPEQDGEEPNLFGVWKSNFNSLVPHFNVGKLGLALPTRALCATSSASAASTRTNLKGSDIHGRSEIRFAR